MEAQHVHHPVRESASGFWNLLEVYVPRRQCMNYEAGVIWLHLVSDLLIAFAYFTIPLALVYVVRRRKDLEFNWMFLLFALFIILCGTTHLFNVAALWIPLYRLDGLVKLLTGCASVATAILLWRMLPQALAVPSPAQLRVLNFELSQEVNDRKRAEAEVRLLNETLERRVEQRAAELARVAADLERAQRLTSETLAVVDTLLMNAPVGIGLYDSELRFLRVNRALADINGIPLEVHEGKRIVDLLPGLPDQVRSCMETVVETRQPVLNQEVTGETPKHPGETRFWRASYYPVQTAQKVFVGIGAVVEDITEQKRAVDALRDSSRRKDEFLAMLSHELRNPLAPIKNAAQVLKVIPSPSEHLRQAQAMIDRQVDHLSRLVDDLLDVSRISGGKIKLKMEPVEIADVVNSAVESSRPYIDDRRHTLSVSLPEGSLRVSGDLTRLSQVLLNVLINSAKYTPEGGHLQLVCKREGTSAVIRVRDDGIGISADLLPHVFDLFTQAEQALDRSQGGLGIGLTLVKRLVEAHGGTVSAASDGRGKGAELTVRLPLTDEAVPKADTAGTAGAKPDQGSQPSQRILVVDDNVDAADSLALLLRLSGKEVRTAYDGPSALAIATEYRPEVVFLDIGLPGMDGYEVAKQLQAMKECAAASLVALTGYGSDQDRLRSLSNGFSAHLVKPIDTDALAKLLNSLRGGTPS